MNPAELRDLASSVAVAAGDLARAGSTKLATVEHKSGDTDLVTEFDRAAEQHLVEAIGRARPDDGIVGEEGTSVTGRSGLVWYLDPIDGTTNFVHRHPMWSTSVAVGDGAGMIAGAVYAPAMGTLYAAATGLGATCNGDPIAASELDTLSRAVIATGFGYDAGRRLRQSARVAKLIDRIADIRRGGSAALDLCFVAAGYVDAYYEEHLNIWDLAAGDLIAREAGCRSGPIGGHADPSGLVVAAPGLFDELRSLLATTA